MKRRKSRMGRIIYVGLAIAMVVGLGVYLRLWSIDSEFSNQDRELIRRQFDLANKEAMDEAAEWRFKYDVQFDKASNCTNHLFQVKEALEKKMKEAADIKKNLATLQKENIGLRDQVESLTRELQIAKLNRSL